MFLLKIFAMEPKHALICREAGITIYLSEIILYFKPAPNHPSLFPEKLSKDIFLTTHLHELFYVYAL